MKRASLPAWDKLVSRTQGILHSLETAAADTDRVAFVGALERRGAELMALSTQLESLLPAREQHIRDADRKRWRAEFLEELCLSPESCAEDKVFFTQLAAKIRNEEREARKKAGLLLHDEMKRVGFRVINGGSKQPQA